MASRSYIYPSSTRGKAPQSTRGNGSQIPQTYQAESPRYLTQNFVSKRLMSTGTRGPHPSKKRKVINLSQVENEDNGEDEIAAAAAQASLAGIDNTLMPARVRKKKGEEPEERRLKRFRQKPPLTYLERLGRVKTQRMFLINRKRTVSDDGTHEEEVFDLAGSTGNIYQITISKIPKCTCPDAGKGNQCKHIIYILVNVLKTREDLAYQLAFLTKELAEIFVNAPVTSLSPGAAAEITDTGGTRKPIEGDCPVCVMEFDKSDKSEDILWCKGACGNNIHRTCLEQWARSKPGQVKCVYCRTSWKGDEGIIERISKSGTINHEGYVNVASELGISHQRDVSSYHNYWVRREFGGGHGGRYGDYDDY